jgi:hypothetical protein
LGWITYWRKCWLRRFAGPAEPTQIIAARELLRAIDAGGIPLNPMRVNQIARQLDLEVSTRAPMEETIERIRQRLQVLDAGSLVSKSKNQ